MKTFDPTEHGPYGIVFYTDGSAQPNPGYCGSGIHGYVYRRLKEKEQPTRFNGWIATEKGYCIKQDVEKGDREPVLVLQYFDTYQSYPDIGTNNQAELNAVSIFFESYPELAQGAEKICLLADSQYVLNGIRDNLQSWKNSNWYTRAGTPVKNQTEWMRLDRHITPFKESGQLEFDWVEGHNDNFGNVRADYLAGIGTILSTRGQSARSVELRDPQQYHKTSQTLHPFINLRRVYFNTDPTYNTPGIYYQTGWSDSGHVEGRRSSDSTFSVVSLDQPDRSVETLIEAQYEADNSFNSLVYIKLDRLKNDEIQLHLERYGSLCLSCDNRSVGLSFLDRKPVTVESAAGELSFRSIDVLNHLEKILTAVTNDKTIEETEEIEAFRNHQFNNFRNHQLHNVTDHFYDKVEKTVRKELVTKYELKKTFGVGVKKTEVGLTVDDQALTAHIVFGDDLPARNALKAMEDHTPEVYVITWKESQKVLRYATLIKTEGARGIWCNYFANYVFLDALQSEKPAA